MENHRFALYRWPLFSRLVPVRDPLSEELNPGLRPGTFSSRRRGRHDGPADATNPVVDGRGVCFHVVIICEIERLAHGVNVMFREERANVRLKARLCRHNSKNLKDTVNGAVGAIDHRCRPHMDQRIFHRKWDTDRLSETLQTGPIAPAKTTAQEFCR